MELADTLALAMASQTEKTLIIDTDICSHLENTNIQQVVDFHTNGDGAKLSENSKCAVDVNVVNIKTEIIENYSYQNVDTAYKDGNCTTSNYFDTGIIHDAYVAPVKSEPTDEPLETTNHTIFIIEIDTCKDEYCQTRGYPNSHTDTSLVDHELCGSRGDCVTKEGADTKLPHTQRCKSNTPVDIQPCAVLLSDIQYTYPDIVTNRCVRVHDKQPTLQIRVQSTAYDHALQQSKHKPHQCPFCALSFPQKGNMNTHMRIHTGEKPHKCYVCDVSFTQKGNLTRHMRMHTGEKPYLCSVCGIGFAHSTGLKDHTAMHPGMKHHKCGICEVSFTTKHALTRHMRTHTGEKPYKCSVCGVGFRRSNHLKTHKTIHTGEKPHTCSVCEVSFREKSGLTSHMRTHTGEKPYKCVDCG